MPTPGLESAPTYLLARYAEAATEGRYADALVPDVGLPAIEIHPERG
jgi:hypothetical protein